MAAESKYSSFLEMVQEEDERDVLRAMVRTMISELMHEEVARHLGAEPHERTRSRKGHRNGYKPRTLNTRLGKLGFEVPQVRGTDPYQPMFFERW